MPSVKITPEDTGTFLFQTFGMSRKEFSQYLEASKGASYVKPLNANRATLDVSVNIVARLHALGFSFFTDDTTMSRFKAAILSRQSASNKLEARIEALKDVLYPYQVEGVRYLGKRSRALLADDMGLGKTIQTLSAIPDGHRVLVECPSSVKSVWEGECYKWRDGYFPTILNGRGNFRWPNVNELLIVNNEIVPDSKEIPVPPKDGKLIVIYDELHRFKSERTVGYKKLKAISNKALAVDAKMWGLTATPMLNRQPELWAVLDLLDLAREAFGSKTKFATMCGGFFIKNLNKFEWGQPSEEAKHAVGRVMLRREKAEVGLQLPAKSYADVQVSLPENLLSECQLAWADVEPQLTEEKIPFQAYSKLRQAISTAKTEAALEWVENMEAAGEAVGVFSAHVAPLEVIAKRLGWALITGSVSASKRQKIVEEFQDGKLLGIAMSIQAAGVGITLTRGCNALFISQEWTPALNWQAEARFDRIGQTRPVTIYRLVGNHPLERRVAEINRDKAVKIHAMVVQTARVESAPLGKDWVATDVPKIITIQQVTREANDSRERSYIECLQMKADKMNGGDKRAADGIIRTLPMLTEGQWKLAKALSTKYERF